MEDGKVTASGGGHKAGNGTGAWPPHSRVHQDPGSAFPWHHLARSGLRYPTPGALGHMPGNPTLLGPSPQLPALMSKQSSRRRRRVSRDEQQGYSGERAAQEKALLSTGVRGWEGKGGAWGGRAGQTGQSWVRQRGGSSRRRGGWAQRWGLSHLPNWMPWSPVSDPSYLFPSH